MKVAFVCSGNICRSPMAEGLARDLFARRNIDATVTSAGTFHIEGRPADPHAVQALDAMAIDIRGHRSRGTRREVLADCHLIWVMSPEHEDSLTRHHPDLEPRVQRLWQFADPQDAVSEIRDPLGGELADFERCRDLILKCLVNWLDQQRGPG